MSRSKVDAPQGPTHIDWERLDLWAKEPGSPSFVAELAHIFLEDIPGRLQKLKSLLEPLEKEAAQRAAHAVKGAARNFGAVGMAELAEEIERSLAGSGRDVVSLWEELCREFEIVRELLDPVLLSAEIPAELLGSSQSAAPDRDGEPRASQD